MSLKLRRTNTRNVRIPERIGAIAGVYAIDGQAFAFLPVLPAEIKQGKNFVWRWLPGDA